MKYTIHNFLQNVGLAVISWTYDSSTWTR